MLDPLDYKEPACALCGGEAFYNFGPKKPQGHIPVDAVIRKLDDCLARENYAEGARVLRYWIEDAKALNDRRGELSVQNEVLGLSRRIGDKPWGLAAVERCLQLIAEIGGEGLLSTAPPPVRHSTNPNAPCRFTTRQKRFMKGNSTKPICALRRFTTTLQQR